MNVFVGTYIFDLKNVTIVFLYDKSQKVYLGTSESPSSLQRSHLFESKFKTTSDLGLKDDIETSQKP